MLAPDPEGGKGAMNKERGGLWRLERPADGLPPAASGESTVLPAHFRLWPPLCKIMHLYGFESLDLWLFATAAIRNTHRHKRVK